MRNFSFPHETMPVQTDAEFVAMVKQAKADGIWNSTWINRLLAIAERKARWTWFFRKDA
jgi:hypothetical protein